MKIQIDFMEKTLTLLDEVDSNELLELLKNPLVKNFKIIPHQVTAKSGITYRDNYVNPWTSIGGTTTDKAWNYPGTL